MRPFLLLLGCMAMGSYCHAQYVYTINADSVKITNHCDSAELIIQNHTQGVTGGFLYNTWNGRTIFKKVLQKISDSIYLIGPDTLKLVSGTPNLQEVTNGSGNNITTNSMYSYDSVYSIKSAVHGTLYVGDSATYASVRQQDTIYGYGNSIIAGTFSVTQALCFFSQYCTYTGAYGINNGESGTFLSQFLTLELSTLPAWKPHHKVMLLYETNDYFAGESINSYMATYQTVLDSIMVEKGYPKYDIDLLFCSLPDTTINGIAPAGMAVWANSLDSMAAIMGIPHADLYHFMLDNGGDALTWPTNREHPQQNGHNVITQAMLLDLNQGSGDFRRPLFTQTIKTGQQLTLDAPTVYTMGNRIRETTINVATATADLQALVSGFSSGGSNIRPEISGGGPSGNPISCNLMVTNSLGQNIPTGIGAYTHTDTSTTDGTLGFPQTDNHGFAIYEAPTGGTTFTNFSGAEAGSGSTMAIYPGGTNQGVYLYASGGVSIGHSNCCAAVFETDEPFEMFNNAYLFDPGISDGTDGLLLRHFNGGLDTTNLRNSDTSAFLTTGIYGNPAIKHIYPSTIGASPFGLTSAQIIAGLGYTPASTSGGSDSSSGIGTGTVSYTAGSGAGSGATVSVDGTNEGGLITLTTGTSLLPSEVLVTVTYSTPFPNKSYPITRAANAATAPVETTDQATYLSATASGFSIVASSNVLAANTTYQWYYNVSGR